MSLPRPPGTAPDPEQRRLTAIRNALALCWLVGTALLLAAVVLL